MKRNFAVFLTLCPLAAVWFFVGQSNEPGQPSLLVGGQSVGQETQSGRAEHVDVQFPANYQAAQTSAVERKPAAGTPQHESSSLTVRVSGLRPQGDVLVAVFEKASGFPNRDDAALTCTSRVTDNEAHIRFEDLAPGNYAVAIFQDLNADGVLNKSGFGAPTEPYGFSNNVRGNFGPPSFQAASFTLALGSQDLDVTVK